MNARDTVVASTSTTTTTTSTSATSATEALGTAELTISDLLAATEQSDVDGRHRDGGDQAEQVLARANLTAAEQARARASLAQHRLRLGEFEASVRHGLLALELLSQSGDRLRQSQVHCTLALAFHETGLNEPALRHVLGALEAARDCGSRSAEFWALSRYSMVHIAMGDARRAVELGRAALGLAREIDDPEVIFAGLNNLGDTLLEATQATRALGLDDTVGDLQEALELVQEAVQNSHRQGQSFNDALARTNLVSILIELGRYPEAREQAISSRALAEANGYRNLRINNDAQLAEVVRAEGHVDEATAMMEVLLDDPSLEVDPALLSKLHRSLIDMHKEHGRFENALRLHEQLHTLLMRMTVQTAGLQARMLINTLEIGQAHHEAERSQFEARLQRTRAEEMDAQAHTDSLTGLPNRRALDRQLPALVSRAQERAEPLCAAMIDCDQFKRVNDEHGHGVGDQVLTAMGSMLRGASRDSDLAVRVGGEEFLLVFGDTTLDEAEHACERMLAAVRAYPWASLADGLSCTVSAGVAALLPHESVPHWLARADAALYGAKRDGRDRVGVAS